jgi:RHS repeat-associated protein
MPVEIISFSKDSVTTNYVYDGTNLVAEMRPNASGTLVVVTSYLLGAQGIEAKIDENAQTEAYYKIDPTTGSRLFDSNNNLIVAYRGVTSWYVYDGHGNVVGTVNGVTGAFAANPTLDVYGVPRASGAAATKQGYCGSLGHVTDDTGLVYMRARYYDPGCGRFVSEDPTGNGANWYIYASNNPVNAMDQTGKFVILGIIAVILIGAIAALGWYLGDVAGYNWFMDEEVGKGDPSYQQKQYSFSGGAPSTVGGGILNFMTRGASYGRGIGCLPLARTLGIAGVVGAIIGFESGIIEAELTVIDEE